MKPELPELETKFYKLERLVKWEHVDKVNEMLLSNVSPRQVASWCGDNGFDISQAKLYEYKGLLQRAISQNISVEHILGLGSSRRTPKVLESLGINGGVKALVKNEMEVLDSIIQAGFNTLLETPVVSVSDAMKAIDLKNKITGGGHAGLTNYGLDQLRELEQHKFEAILGVVLKYVPEGVHEELYQAMAQAERQYYETQAPELLEEYERMIEEELNSSPQNTIVSDTKF